MGPALAARVKAMKTAVLLVTLAVGTAGLHAGAVPRNPIRSRELHTPYARGRPVIGVDESGRGAIAGALFAAAIWLPPGWSMRKAGVRVADSKDLTTRQREEAVSALAESGAYFRVAAIGPREIDRTRNITHVTHVAMARAVEQLEKQLVKEGVLDDGSDTFSLVDGNMVPSDLYGKAECLPGGDQKELCIAAASIIAKVARDHAMRTAQRRSPKWRFNEHKGYGTKEHLELIARYGPSMEHRMSVSPFVRRTGRKLNIASSRKIYKRIQSAQQGARAWGR